MGLYQEVMHFDKGTRGPALGGVGLEVLLLVPPNIEESVVGNLNFQHFTKNV